MSVQLNLLPPSQNIHIEERNRQVIKLNFPISMEEVKYTITDLLMNAHKYPNTTNSMEIFHS